MRQSTLLLAASLGIAFASHAFASDRPDPVKLTEKCTKEAADKFDVKHDYVQLQPLQSSDSGYTMSGTADAGIDGKKNFTCQFDKKGKFANLVQEGK